MKSERKKVIDLTEELVHSIYLNATLKFCKKPQSVVSYAVSVFKKRPYDLD
jgi:hypothetical protein